MPIRQFQSHPGMDMQVFVALLQLFSKLFCFCQPECHKRLFFLSKQDSYSGLTNAGRRTNQGKTPVGKRTVKEHYWSGKLWCHAPLAVVLSSYILSS